MVSLARLRPIASRTVVWLAAVMLPVNTLSAGACRCGGSAATAKSGTGCAHCGSRGQAERPAPVKTAGCCQAHSTGRAGESCRCVVSCRCDGKQPPSPVTPVQNDDPTGKQLAGHAATGALTVEAVQPPATAGLARAGDLSSAATPLELCSELCRFLL